MMQNDWFFDKFEQQLDDHPVRTQVSLWAVSAFISLTFLAVVIFIAAIAFRWAFGGVM